MNFHPEELIIPNWLDFPFFENILRSSEGDKSIKVLDVKIVPAAPLGDHFASIMYRATITFSGKNKSSNQEKSVIIKTMPIMEGVLKDILGKSPVFKTEINMYSKILPEMNRLLKNAGYKDEIAPNALYHSLDPYQVIVFEDITPAGFISTKVPLNYNAAKMVAAKLAKFHGTAYYMHHNNHIDLSAYKDGIFTKGILDAEKMFNDNLQVFKSVMIKLPELQKFKYNIERFADTVFEKLHVLYTENKGGLNVLNHGDFHFKNIMFRYDEKNEIIATKFIDFQLCLWASPAIDLMYLLYAIALNDVRDQSREKLIYYYYQEFVDTLKMLGFIGNVPTLLDFHIELLKNGYFEMFMISTMLIFLYVDIQKIDVGKIMIPGEEADAMKRSLYNLPFYQKEVIKNVPRLVYKGFM